MIQFKQLKITTALTIIILSNTPFVHANISTNPKTDITKAIFSKPKSNQYNVLTKLDTQKVLDDFIATSAKKYYITGIPLTVQCEKFNKNIPITYNAGFQSNSNEKPVNNSSLWQIGSNAKSFLSVVILQLEAENKLSLEDKISKYFPGIYPRWENITIKQLLNMTSGIHDYLNDEIDIPNKIGSNPYRIFTTDEILNSVKDLELWFTPGTKWSYSNTNYVLAGKIVEKITGQTVAEEIEKRIIKPLNLQHTYYITTFQKENVPFHDKDHIMSGYYVADYFPNIPKGADVIDYSMSWANAAGAVISTTSDLNDYIRALFSGKLLAKTQFNELISLVDETATPLPSGVDKTHPEGYGLGIQASYMPDQDTVIYSHGGGTLGFKSWWKYIPKTKASIIFSLNTSMEPDIELIDFLIAMKNSLPESCLNIASSASNVTEGFL